MFKVYKNFACFIFILLNSVFIAESQAGNLKFSMDVIGVTSAPIGFIRFCASYPDDCSMQNKQARPIKLTEKKWRELLSINDYVNRAIDPMTDADLYGVSEHWTYPREAGDCEDYVILKRRMMMEKGWPASALLITVVRDTKGNGHAVLTVRTDRGDFILDNQEKLVVRWDQTPYQFIKRQSEYDAYMWAKIADERTLKVGSIQ